MTAKKLFFCLCENHPDKPHFKEKLVSKFVRANEISEGD